MTTSIWIPATASCRLPRRPLLHRCLRSPNPPQCRRLIPPPRPACRFGPLLLRTAYPAGEGSWVSPVPSRLLLRSCRARHAMRCRLRHCQRATRARRLSSPRSRRPSSQYVGLENERSRCPARTIRRRPSVVCLGQGMDGRWSTRVRCRSRVDYGGGRKRRLWIMGARGGLRRGGALRVVS